MSNFNEFNTDLTPVGITITAVSWLNIFGLVSFNPMLQSIVYLMTIIWLSMQMFAFVKKHYKKKL